jgi:hypothetical protein
VARLVLEGFECSTRHGNGSGYPGSTGWQGAWTDPGTFDFIENIAGYALADGAGWWSDYSCGIEDYNYAGWDLGADKTEVYGSFYFKTDTSQTYNIWEFGRGPGSLPQASIGLAAGQLVARRGGSGGTILGTGPLFTTGVWYHIEYRYLCDQTTGRFVVKVDGDTKIDYTGDTAVESTANFRYLWLLAGTGNANGYFDDVIVNDTSGSTNTSWPDGEVVVGLRASGSGDTNDLDPGRGNGSETTFQRAYIDEFTFDVPDISPAPDALWNRVDSFARLNLQLDVNVETGRESVGRNESWVVTGTGVQYDDCLMVQAISPPLAAQTISGTFKGYFRVRSNLASFDGRSQLVIRVVSADGATVRGTLYAGDTGTGTVTQEWPASSSTFTNRSFPRSVPASLSSLAISAGDRLVIELGFRIHSASNDQGQLRLGILDPATYPTDLAENETDQGDHGRGWLEFSSAITLAASSAENYRYTGREMAPGAGALLRSSTTDEKDLYTLSNLSALLSSVAAVKVEALVRKTQPGTRKAALPVKRAGTESAGSDITASLSWGRVRRILDTDPTDSSAWTTGKVDALQLGIKVR